MAAKESGAAEREKTKAKAAPKQKESVYTAVEFAENARTLFGVRKECVEAALRAAEIESCTVSKAREIVEAFRRKEVQ